MMLSKIIEHKKESLKEAKANRPLLTLSKQVEEIAATRQFLTVIKRNKGERLKVIAELKKASPSAGVLRENFQPQDLACQLEDNGANALSVLTEDRFFQGSLDYIWQIRRKCALPILRKDFIIDEYQIWESRVAGADAILLIVAVLDKAQLSDFFQRAQQLELECLIEVHDQQELQEALEIKPKIIGINNRNLHDFTVNLKNTEQLLSQAAGQENTVWVSESGINSRQDVQFLSQLGVDAILIGETLMRAPYPGRRLKEICQI